MLIINVKKEGSLDKAIKKLTKKFKDTQVVKELRGRKEYRKPSVLKREIFKKALRRNKMNLDNN